MEGRIRAACYFSDVQKEPFFRLIFPLSVVIHSFFFVVCSSTTCLVVQFEQTGLEAWFLLYDFVWCSLGKPRYLLYTRYLCFHYKHGSAEVLFLRICHDARIIMIDSLLVMRYNGYNTAK